jgi:two-component system, LytTR family, response regulator LytT
MNKVVIVEDDPNWAFFVESALHESKYELLGVSNTIAKAKAMIDGYKPSILICDVRLQEGNIFELLKNIELKKNTSIVFMTSYTDESFFQSALKQTNAAYLVKPFHKFTLLSTLDTVCKNNQLPENTLKTEDFITVTGLHQQPLKIYYKDIEYIQSEGNYSLIHTSNNYKYARKKSLIRLIDQLDNRFIKVHKSFVVNKNFIKKIDLTNRTILINDKSIPLGRGFRNSIDPFLN